MPGRVLILLPYTLLSGVRDTIKKSKSIFISVTEFESLPGFVVFVEKKKNLFRFLDYHGNLYFIFAHHFSYK